MTIENDILYKKRLLKTSLHDLSQSLTALSAYTNGLKYRLETDNISLNEINQIILLMYININNFAAILDVMLPLTTHIESPLN